MCQEYYIFEEKLSEGGFGQIYKVKNKGVFYILKKCRTENITEADSILQEAKYLRDLNHKNIVKYVDDFIHIEFKNSKLENIYYAAIIMEYCEGGDLKNIIDEKYYNEMKFKKPEILDIINQTSEGLYYLHSKGIIHRDIKSSNIFLTKDNTVRIGDFGLAKKIKYDKSLLMTKVGTDCYMAPEVIRGEKYGKAADIWSLGCVILEMATLNFMWMYDSSIGMRAVTHRETFLEEYTSDINKEDEDIKNLIRNMFIIESSRRIKIETILKKIRKEKIRKKNIISNSTMNSSRCNTNKIEKI